MSEQVWFPDDQHGYSIALCECEDGPYLGARQMGTPCVCEQCRRVTREQFEFLYESFRTDETDRIKYLRRTTGHEPVRDADGFVTCADCGERHASATAFPVVACPGPPPFPPGSGRDA